MEQSVQDNAENSVVNAAQSGLQNVAEQKKKKSSLKQFFSARKIATLAMFTALSLVVSVFDFPIFPAAFFLKLDFGNVFIMLVGFLFGPVEGVIVCVIKEVIRMPLGSTGGIGELANIMVCCAYILIPSTVYKFKKSFKVVIPALIAGIIAQTVMGLLTNRFITFPMFFKGDAVAQFNKLYYFIIYFNLIKGTAISVICMLVYKSLSRVLKRFKIK